MNISVIMGRITKDLELKQTPNGKSVLAFSVAVDRGVKNASGETITDFINCVAWEKTAEFISKYFAKGRMICVVGEMQTRKYESNGKKQYVTELRVNKANFTGEKKEDMAEVNMNDINEDMEGFIPVPDDDNLPF